MKTLYLIRHAKSAWDSSASTDFDRPLNERGLSDAPRMAAFLRAQQIVPDQIVSSSAIRANTTARLIARGLDQDESTVMQDRRIYLADVHQLQSILREFPDSWESVMVIGHNPTLTDCANALTGDVLNNLPTCSVYGIRLAIDSWLKLRNGVGERILYQVPKELAESA